MPRQIVPSTDKIRQEDFSDEDEDDPFEENQIRRLSLQWLQDNFITVTFTLALEQKISNTQKQKKLLDILWSRDPAV